MTMDKAKAIRLWYRVKQFHDDMASIMAVDNVGDMALMLGQFERLLQEAQQFERIYPRIIWITKEDLTNNLIAAQALTVMSGQLMACLAEEKDRQVSDTID